MVFKFTTMKNLLFISFLFISFGIHSQGNLQFNKVLNLEYTKQVTGISSNGGADGKNILATVTIPENKVWKVVHVSVAAGDEFRNNAPYSINAVPNGSVAIGGTLIWATMNSNAVVSQYPIWFGSGTKEIIWWQYSQVAGSSNTRLVSISILEFNIIQ